MSLQLRPSWDCNALTAHSFGNVAASKDELIETHTV